MKKIKRRKKKKKEEKEKNGIKNTILFPLTALGSPI
jgi:hypothetical protein